MQPDAHPTNKRTATNHHPGSEARTDDGSPGAHLATDGGEDVSAVFSRLCELAVADGDVPDDGSGLDGVWTRTIEARQRDRDWNVAINAETDQEQTVDGFPGEDDQTTIPPGQATIYLERWPAGVVGPFGGQVIVEELEGGPRSLEDELLRDIETALIDVGEDIERTIPDQEVATDGNGADLDREERRRAFMDGLEEALHEHGEVRCSACEEAGDVDLATIDLSPADDVDEALEIWNDHVRDVHEDDDAETDGGQVLRDGADDDRSEIEQTLDHVVWPQIDSIRSSWNDPESVVRWLRDLADDMEERYGCSFEDEGRDDLVTDGGQETGAPPTRLREAIKQTRIAREDLQRNPRGPRPDQDSSLAKAEYLLRGVADELEEDDGPDELDPSLVTDGGVDLEEMLDAKDGDYEVIEPIDWPYEAVVFGAEVHRDCLALTGSGKPCTYRAYSDDAVCGTHRDAKDPEILEWAHQWARINDGDAVVAVCVNCHEVWSNGVPALLVPCPTCEADIGERCWNDSSHAGKAAPFPPHPKRRRKGHLSVDGYTACSENPLLEGQELATDGGQAVADDTDAEPKQKLPAVGTCSFPKKGGYCDGQHVLAPESLLDENFVRFPCRREGCDAETIMPRGIAIERLDEAGFDVAALAYRNDIGAGSVWLDCPECGTRGGILDDDPLRCRDCGAVVDPEEVA